MEIGRNVNSAIARGQQDRKLGKSLCDNPYKVLSSRKAWATGFHQEICGRCDTVIRPEGGHMCGSCGRDI